MSVPNAWDLVDEVEEDEQPQEQPTVLSLLRHQAAFVNDTTTRELALVGGFGCGKTDALCYKAITLAAINAPFVKSDTVNILIEPNDAQIQNLLRPRFEKILGELSIPFSLRQSPRAVYTLHFPSADVKIVMAPAGAGADAFRGFQAAFIGVDEADTIDPDRLRALWVSLTSRLRGCKDGAHYQLFATTTPEGFNFCYQNWVEDVAQNPELSKYRKLVKGKTQWNPFLPPEYIDNLKRQYPKPLLASYLEGEFVNLEGNIVYTEFDRKLNNTAVTLNDFDSTLPIHIGIDFNNNKTCGIVCIIEAGRAYVIDEITGQKNTKALIEEINERYSRRRVLVYPDAAGRQETTNADQTNIQLLRNAGFDVRAHTKNPRVSNRVNSVNAMFCNAHDERRLFVNIEKCPVLTKTLEQQKYRNGEPDKKHDLDHPNDALGYFVWYCFPITGARATVQPMYGV